MADDAENLAELRRTAAELSRWQGGTDSQVRENSRRLDAINGSIANMAKDNSEAKAAMIESVAEMREAVTVLRTKIGFYSAIGSLGGTAVVSLALLLLSK